MKLKTKRMLTSTIVFTTIAFFAGCATMYAVPNLERFVQFSVGMPADLSSNTQVDFQEERKVETFVPEENSIDYVETFMTFPEGPVDFLDEIMPITTPDPGRNYNEIKELNLTGGDKYGNFYVQDTSGTGVNLLDYVNKDLPFNTESGGEPLVLLYHTHTSESYMTGDTGFYYDNAKWNNTDLNRSVAVVGDVMQEVLESQGIVTIHDTTIHDVPEYTGAYTRSRDTVQSYLDKYPSIQVMIDIHRDSMTTDSGVKYKPTAVIDGKSAAQVMLLAGADPDGTLGYSDWSESLIFATKLQDTAAVLYPNLMRPMMFCQRKYNMDMTAGSILLEVGTEVNTFAEAKYSGQLMANVIATVLDNG